MGCILLRWTCGPRLLQTATGDAGQKSISTTRVHLSPPERGSVPEIPSAGSDLGTKVMRICPVLGFASLAVNSKAKSCANYPVTALANGVMFYDMLFSLGSC